MKSLRLTTAIVALMVIASTTFLRAEPKAVPYVTSNTHYMVLQSLDFSWSGTQTLSNVHEGVFYIKQNKRLSFYLDDGRCLFDDEWEVPSETYNRPYFDGGAAVVRKQLPGWKYQYYILYKDGRMKELEPGLKNVSQFCDGLALMQKADYKWTFIDLSGNHVFPNLSVNGKDYQRIIRPLSEGLRGYLSADNKWGFIDAEGNIKIQPQFKAVKDFHEGFALALDNDGLCVINTKGEVAFRVKGSCSAGDLYKRNEFGDMRCGLINIDGFIYDKSGTMLKEFNYACPFYDGYAYVSHNYTASLVDKQLNVLQTFDSDDVSSSDISDGLIKPYPCGFVSTARGDNVFNHKGEHIIAAWDVDYNNYIHKFSAFSEAGTTIFEGKVNGKPILGFMLTTGEITWIFSEMALTEEDWQKLPDSPTPLPGPYPRKPGPPQPQPYPPVEKIGSKVTETVKYTVTVECSPIDGGTANVVGGPQFEYGDSATIVASPNEDWRVAGIEVNGKRVKKMPFAVVNNSKVVVKFIKKEVVEAPKWSNCYQGTQNTDFDGVPFVLTFYGEISATPTIATPYGDNTYGFVVAMFDPTNRFVSKDASAYIFASPFRIVGYQKEETSGKQYMVLDAGNISFGKLEINASNPLMSLYFNSLMSINGYTSPELLKRRYRVEMCDINEETGEFSCGVMQVYSSEYGWLDGGDKRLKVSSHGFMMSKTDNGLPADFFANVRFSKADKRNDVLWYPPLLWYDNKQSVLDEIINNMKNVYSTYKSDYDLLWE